MSKTLNFEMFTNAGNKKCTEVYEKLVTQINCSKFFNEEEFKKLYEKEINTIRTQFPEVDDTEPEYIMQTLINRELYKRGYSYVID